MGAGQVADGVPIVPCIDPEANGAEDDYNSGEGYPEIGGVFHWITLSPQHKLLAAPVGRTEGYAGGGGSFTGEILFELRGDTMNPVACYATSRYQMFGGEWNPDGSRQHPESQAGWRLKATGTGRWPSLRLIPVTANTPSATLVWDATLGFYK